MIPLSRPCYYLLFLFRTETHTAKSPPHGHFRHITILPGPPPRFFFFLFFSLTPPFWQCPPNLHFTRKSAVVLHDAVLLRYYSSGTHHHILFVSFREDKISCVDSVIQQSEYTTVALQLYCVTGHKPLQGINFCCKIVCSSEDQLCSNITRSFWIYHTSELFFGISFSRLLKTWSTSQMLNFDLSKYSDVPVWQQKRNFEKRLSPFDLWIVQSTV